MAVVFGKDGQEHEVISDVNMGDRRMLVVKLKNVGYIGGIMTQHILVEPSGLIGLQINGEFVEEVRDIL